VKNGPSRKTPTRTEALQRVPGGRLRLQLPPKWTAKLPAGARAYYYYGLLGLNDQGQAVGYSDLPGDAVAHAFLWTKEVGMQDLGTLPGDVVSIGVAMNNSSQLVGTSLDANFNPRAFLWQNGVMTDLNTLIPANSNLSLQLACGINSRGEITGLAMQNSTGQFHAYLATPAIPTAASASPKNVTVTASEITLDGTASTSANGKPLIYQWTIPQGSPSAAILQGNTATPTVQFGVRGVYTFQLTVTDSTGTSATDFATVNFQGN
jgi:probable HAF family extracellular repeat protein